MVNVIYVNEYQPSSATLKLGEDSIYRQSSESETIRVAVSVAPILAVVGLVAGLSLIIYALSV